MSVSKELINDTVEYILHSYSKAKILWMEYEDVSHIRVRYVRDKLFYVYYYDDLNKNRKYFTELIFDGKQYIATTKSGTRNVIPENYPGLMTLYFKEPVNVSKIYFEAQLFTANLEKINDGHYKFTTKDGNENEYIYRDGKIDEMLFRTPIATIRMKRVSNPAK
ncbi:MAG: hypothetical protein NZ522_01465 [Chitinophagales bacterium]|nr:hypothetical protein [Chitinophagales bacterium]